MGKIGILWELDRKTGTFVAAHDLGYQTLVEFDPQTGKVAYRRDMIPRLNVPLKWCAGVRGWKATAYHPETRALYIPIHPGCSESTYGEVTPDNVGNFYYYRDPKYTGARWKSGLARPASGQNRGHLVAMDIKTGKILWRHSTRSAPGTAALTTGGGLVVGTDSEGYVFVHDVANGNILFQTRLATPATGFPITYAIGGTQYIAVTGGNRGTLGGAALYTFAMPASARGALR